ncbi:hypothetical protein D0N87_36175, partial [Pseudomonas sp. ATCC 13867]
RVLIRTFSMVIPLAWLSLLGLRHPCRGDGILRSSAFRGKTGARDVGAKHEGRRMAGLRVYR